jgi:hypothetical protein
MRARTAEPTGCSSPKNSTSSPACPSDAGPHPRGCAGGRVGPATRRGVLPPAGILSYRPQMVVGARLTRDGPGQAKTNPVANLPPCPAWSAAGCSPPEPRRRQVGRPPPVPPIETRAAGPARQSVGCPPRPRARWEPSRLGPAAAPEPLARLRFPGSEQVLRRRMSQRQPLQKREKEEREGSGRLGSRQQRAGENTTPPLHCVHSGLQLWVASETINHALISMPGCIWTQEKKKARPPWHEQL